VAKRSASSARVRRTARKSSVIEERKIDYSDIPPLSPEQLRAMTRVGDRALKPHQLVRIVKITTA
jgi:hypothetical protein